MHFDEVELFENDITPLKSHYTTEIHQDVAERIVEEYFSKYDLDGDKSINLAEFHSWTSSGRTKEEMRERFRFADKDGNDRGCYSVPLLGVTLH